MPKKTGQKIATMDANRYYTIVSEQSKKALEAGANNAIYMNDADGSEGQQWSFVPAADCYSIVSRQTGEVIDILLAGTEDGAQIHQWEEIGVESQQWIVAHAKKGTYKIFAKTSGKCLDVVGISGENGAHVQIWEDLDGENQHWLIEDPTAAKLQSPKKPAAKKPAAKKPAAKTAAKPAAKAPVAKPAAKPAAPKAAKPAAVKKSATKVDAPVAKLEAPVKLAAPAKPSVKVASKADGKKTTK